MNFETTVLVVTCLIITVMSLGAALYALFFMRPSEKSSLPPDSSTSSNSENSSNISEREAMILKRAEASAASAEARKLIEKARRDGKV